MVLTMYLVPMMDGEKDTDMLYEHCTRHTMNKDE